MSRSVIVFVCFLLASTCPGEARQTDVPTPKSEKTALRYSLVSTAAPVVAGGVIFFAFSDKFENWDDGGSILAASIGSAGVIFGPGVGHAYAGNSGRLITGALLRAISIAFVPAAVGWSSAMEGEEDVGPEIILPISAVVGSAVYDIVTVDRSVDKYNREHGFTQLGIVPLHATSGKIVGLKLTVAW